MEKSIDILQLERSLSVLPIDLLQLCLRRYTKERVERGALPFRRLESRDEVKDFMVLFGPSAWKSGALKVVAQPDFRKIKTHATTQATKAKKERMVSSFIVVCWRKGRYGAGDQEQQLLYRHPPGCSI